MDEKMIRIGSRILDLRIGHQFSQKDLAELLGISDKKLSRIERGTQYMDIRVAAALSRVMKVPLEYIFEDMEYHTEERLVDEETFVYYFRLLKDFEKESVLNLMSSIVELRSINSQKKE
ncbi:MAG: helix-turn-helix domain-containing protein [Lachnospiraceae bacterium]|nr:helix-turn-helix domain-containing protein [Lachnospiraceae bacterium]